MMKRAVEELNGRWEVKSVGVSCPPLTKILFYEAGLADEQDSCGSIPNRTRWQRSVGLKQKKF